MRQQEALPPAPEVETAASHVVAAARKIHGRFGPGLLESVYRDCLAIELRMRGLAVEREVWLPVEYEGVTLERAFRLDLLVEKCLIVEVKAVESLLPVHGRQVLTYLKLADRRLALLINFNVRSIGQGINRIIP